MAHTRYIDSPFPKRSPLAAWSANSGSDGLACDVYPAGYTVLENGYCHSRGVAGQKRKWSGEEEVCEYVRSLSETVQAENTKVRPFILLYISTRLQNNDKEALIASF